MSKDLKVFVDQESKRLAYTLDFIFTSNQIQYQIIKSLESIEPNDVVLNYSSKESEIVGIHPASLLFDEGIQNYTIDKGEFGGEVCLVFNGITDPLATIFYMLSRYEEYSSDNKDHHDRFFCGASVAFKFGFHQQVICDRLSKAILDSLKLEFPIQKTTIVPTFDIDNAFAYKYKAGLRKFLSKGRDILQGNRERIEERKKVLSGEKDPYDTFDVIQEISRNVSVKVFWLCGGSTKFDRNLSLTIKEYADLIQKMASSVDIGIHPSYNSMIDTSLISKEKSDLENVIGSKVTASRNHFLRIKFPDSYRSLIQNHIHEDYSMGYSDMPGFRAGTARKFNWFDLVKNEETSLEVHSFAYMDGTLNEYQKLTVSESKSIILELYNEVNNYGGQFMFIWHNETINDYGKWKGWREVLDFSIGLSNE